MSEALPFSNSQGPNEPELQGIFEESNRHETVDPLDAAADAEEKRAKERKKHTVNFPAPPNLVGDTDWQEKAACRPEHISDEPLDYYKAFDGEGTAEQQARAKKICFGCAAAVQCLTFALENDKHTTGIWGGLTEDERRRPGIRKVTMMALIRRGKSK